MNELLRMANELVGWRKEHIPGEWETCPDIEYADQALSVIKGYQELLRQIIDAFDDREPWNHGILVGKLSVLMDEIRASIPKEKTP